MNEKQNKKEAKTKKPVINIKNMGVNIDKAEYQQIVLSNSNFPDRENFYKN